VAPVALRREIAEEQAILPAGGDRRHRPGDLAGNEGLAAGRPLVVEQDAVARVQAIGLAVVDRDPIGVELGRAIGAARLKIRGFAQRPLRIVAVELGGRGLVDAGLSLSW
jgi:hypothetical protein